MKFSVLIFAIFFTLSCNSVSQSRLNDSKIIGDSSKIYVGIDSLYLVEKLVKHLNENIEPLPKADKEECENWELTPQKVEGIFSSMKLVTNEERYALCYHATCYYTSKVQNSQEEYNLSIYSNSSIELSNDDTTLIYIQKKPSKLFLIPCDCCE